MLQNKTSKQHGFTLIEVVLVLAIGGLIFLLAFLAFQQVSTNRRDTQRRSDAGRILAEIENFRGDSNSAVVSEATTTNGSATADTGICTINSTNFSKFATAYLCKDGLFASPDGTNYNSLIYNSASAPTTNQIRITTTFVIGYTSVVAKDCSGNDMPVGVYKVEIGLERGVVCRDTSA